MKFYHIIFSFIKKNKGAVFTLSFSYFIFGVILFLSSLPLDAVFYAATLTLLFIILTASIRFWSYYNKHILLTRLKESIIYNTDNLPEPDDILHQDYQQLIQALYENKAFLLSSSDRSRSEMTDYYTMWVHQIKTPIAAMRLLLQSEHPMDQQAVLQELFKIERYVELVLGYLRMENMSSDLVLKHSDLSSILHSAVKKYASVFIYKKIKLELREMNCSVLTDEKWLIFVIEQILSNALKYTKSGLISIYLDETREKTLIIEDTGIGIQEEDLPRVFERGFTGYNGHMDKKSTGIGLYLCKKILYKLSHSIHITSETGTGTKVHIDLSNAKLYSID